MTSPMMDDVKRIYRLTWWALMLRGLLSLAVVWAAWWLLVTGILGIYVALQLRRVRMDWGWPMAFGVLSVVAGFFALLSPPATLAAIMGLIAGFAIVVAIVSIAGAFKLRALVHP